MTFSDNSVSVLFLKTHVGHDYEVDRLTLTREERDSIAAKIAVGISFDEILAELHSSKHERLRIMTRKDLYNIETSYHLNSGAVRRRHSKVETIMEQHNVSFNIVSIVFLILSRILIMCDENIRTELPFHDICSLSVYSCKKMVSMYSRNNYFQLLVVLSL